MPRTSDSPRRLRRRRGRGRWLSRALLLSSVGLIVGLLVVGGTADEVVFKSGARVKGKIVEQTAEHVKIRVPRGSGHYTLTVRRRVIESIRIEGEPPTPQPGPSETPGPSQTPTAPPGPTPAAGRPNRSAAEVRRLVQEAGTTNPPWWDSVELDYPETLNLKWERAAGGWQPNQNLGAYLIETRKRPERWKATVKLLHKVLEINKDDADKRLRTMRELARNYQILLCDYARAAYWWARVKKAAGRRQRLNEIVDLADCYQRLGSRELARKEIGRLSNVISRSGVLIRFLGSIGLADRAVAMARDRVRRNAYPDTALLAAADACRYAGRFDDAVKLYEKVLSISGGGGGLRRNQQRARAGLEAVKAFKDVKLAELPDGTYTAESPGFRGPVKVQVVVAGGRIESAKVVGHREDWFAAALSEVPRLIEARQGIAGVDAVSGATFTSEAILNAAGKALGGGR
jgi:uncharacterized protein with FMN-binding domain